MNGEILVEAERVSRAYGHRQAVDDVSFTASRGQITGFLGPNGAGKSTLMQVVCGVLAPGAGSVRIAGYDLLEQPLAARRRLGYLPETPPLYPDCTVDEYLAYAGRLKGLKGDALAEALASCKQSCGLDGAGRRLTGNLSKGYRQRVGIAQALIHAPDVIVLDEPSSGLDPNQMLEVRRLIRSMAAAHCIILSTHLLGEARELCDRILVMRDGRVVMDADPAALGAVTGRRHVVAAFRNPPDSPGDIAALEGVLDIQPAGGTNRYRITCTGDPAVLERIADTASARHWGLTELAGEADALERAYLRLTGGADLAEAP